MIHVASMENCIKFKLATDAVLKGEKSEFITYLLDRNRSPLPIADIRCSIDIRHIHARFDDKHDNHTIVHGASSCATCPTVSVYSSQISLSDILLSL